MQSNGISKLIPRIVGVCVLAFFIFNICVNVIFKAQEKPKNWVKVDAVVDQVGTKQMAKKMHLPQAKDFLTYSYKYSAADYTGEAELEIGGVDKFKQGQHISVKVNADAPAESEFKDYEN